MSSLQSSSAKKIVVIGGGIGGLTTGALLAKAGHHVTLLEAHVYPGGCAGTFYHKGYRFDAGATLAGGFYPSGPMDMVAQLLDIKEWPIIDEHSDLPAMVVHMPDGSLINRWSGEKRWTERRQVFGAQSEEFFHWQERSADLLWDLALRTPPWPPQSIQEVAEVIQKGSGWLLANINGVARHLFGLLADGFGYVDRRLQKGSDKLRLFTDAQLLIASQATSSSTNALYGASALDLPRRGVVHLQEGIGSIAETIAQAFQEHGGDLRYREEVKRIYLHEGQPHSVATKRGHTFDADIVVANLPPWNVKKLIQAADDSDDKLPARLRELEESPQKGGGAFMVYAGIDSSVVPSDLPLHHQVVVREPLGEGNSVFLSLSPAGDESRAPEQKRALTISTHTHIDPWWKLFNSDKERYEKRKHYYTEKLLSAAEQVLPTLREGLDLVKPGTPVTFQRFTRREWGWVGGFPQSSLFESWGPRLAPGLWMVGDTIFPGQSTAAVALGGVRVANSITASINHASEKSGTRPVQHKPLAMANSAKSI